MQQIWETIVKSQSVVEWVAVVTSLICVWLTIRNNIWNWFWGFIGVILYGYIFWNYKNYANAGLQILYFLPIQFIGWYVWKRKGPNQDDDLPVTQLTTQVRLLWVGMTMLLTGALYVVLRLTNDPLPFGDGITTAMSIVAQYLQVHKKIENWWLWIVADIIYAAYIFPAQQLYVSSGLYILFTGLAVYGAISWVKIMRGQSAAAAAAAEILRAQSATADAETARSHAR